MNAILSHVVVATIALGVGFIANGRYEIAGDTRAPIKMDRFTGRVWVWKSALQAQAESEVAGQIGGAEWIELVNP